MDLDELEGPFQPVWDSREDPSVAGTFQGEQQLHVGFKGVGDLGLMSHVGNEGILSFPA